MKTKFNARATPIILGSQSSRRSEILGFFNIPFAQVSSNFDEDSIPFNDDPKEYAQAISQGKAKAVAQAFPNAVVLTADTIVYKEGKIYQKPQHRDEGFRHLKELSRKWHSVFTGLSLSLKGSDFQIVEETRVLFNALTEQQIQAYLQAFDCSDKAGGYGIQGGGGLIVKAMEGCYYNVLGLPINALCSLLRCIGIDLWTHFKRSS